MSSAAFYHTIKPLLYVDSMECTYKKDPNSLTCIPCRLSDIPLGYYARDISWERHALSHFATIFIPIIVDGERMVEILTMTTSNGYEDLDPIHAKLFDMIDEFAPLDDVMALIAFIKL